MASDENGPSPPSVLDLSPVDEQKEEHPCEHMESDNGDNRPSVLVTNDDGIHAPGLIALVRALVHAGRCNVLVCAPDSDKSGTGHSVTTREPIAVNSVEMQGVMAFEVAGTPVDCVSLGLSGMLFPCNKPSLVLSGINEGSNCGYHIIYSGTVGGAREAFLCGIPSISLSLKWEKGVSCEADFQSAAGVCLPLIHKAIDDIEKGIFPKGFFLNVDVPINPLQNKGFRFTRQGAYRMGFIWKAANSFKRPQSVPGQGIGTQLAQLGLAASAAGAARRLNSPFKVTEIESVAGPDKGISTDGQKTHYFRRELVVPEESETNEEHDFECLELGYITVTPLGLCTYLDPESLGNATSWISSITPDETSLSK